MVFVLGIVIILKHGDHPWYRWHPRYVDHLKGDDHPRVDDHFWDGAVHWMMTYRYGLCQGKGSSELGNCPFFICVDDFLLTFYCSKLTGTDRWTDGQTDKPVYWERKHFLKFRKVCPAAKKSRQLNHYLKLQ